ncbi:BTAD domain-containing putative transcriptional regulator [Kitasatospora sp. NPDC101183]|uniref:BTAD domain-containing putative transcriptional regulator n=1 Tax=Kitasatospora sp. NPDC101183 TaxID=3364100 RepID=UPI003817FA7F
MHVGILGPLEVTVEGRAVGIGGARLRTLLIRLALDAGRVVGTDALADALWPEGGPAAPGHALHSLVSRLRTALGGHPALRSAAGGYLLDLPPGAVDALRFTRLAGEGRQLLRQGRPEQAARRLREALGLWRGEALAEVAGAAFASAAATGFAELRISATEDALEAELASAADRPYLIAELSGLVAEHPFRERLRVLLVRALGADGRQAEALAAYEEYRALLAEELGADPGPELRAAHLAALRADGPAVAAPGNLPAPISSFVGRAEELGLIAARLREGRLVTLVGPGGVGKTRLAVEAASELPGGAWLVELAAVTEPRELARFTAETLGLRAGGPLDGRPPARDPLGLLVEALGGAEAVLVLDNCEHLLDAAAHFAAQLLGRCPGLRILATSREPLGLPGEALCRVPPLGLPGPGAPAAEAVGFPAVRLFADRAAAVRPGFTLSPVEADAVVETVVEICRRLDGLPLAIELTAARLRSVPVAEIAARLDDRFRLVVGGSRIALPRQRTLRGVVAWSWELLDGAERELTELLAVFHGGIDLRDAEGVHARTGSAPEPLLDRLSALVDKSLLHLVEGPRARYRMLETIREYGLERLAESGRLDAARRHHAAHFLDLAERSAPRVLGPEQPGRLARLVAERGNLRAALHHALDTGDAEAAARLGAALAPVWTVLGDHAEAAARLDRALAVPGGRPTPARTTATAFRLLNRILSGDLARPDAIAAEALELARATDPAVTGPAAALIEASLSLAHDPARGLAAIDRDLPHCDPWGRGLLLLLRAFLQSNHSDLPGTRASLRAAAEAFRASGERWGLALTLTASAHAHSTVGEFDRAIVELEEAVRLLREIDPADDAVAQRSALAVARARTGDTARARAELLALLRPGPGLAPPRRPLAARIALGDLARQEGDHPEAARHYAEAAEDLARLPAGRPLLDVLLRTSLGHLALAGGDTASAARHLREALRLAAGVPDMAAVATVAIGAARLLVARGEAPAAAELLGTAHTLRGAADRHDPDAARLAEALEPALGPAPYAQAYGRGRSHPPAEALAAVRAALSEPG